MMVWVVRIVTLLALLAMIHVALGRYLRWDRSKRLETEFDSGSGQGMSRGAYVARGLADFDRSLGKHLLWLIWLVPLAVVGLLIMIAEHM